MCKRCAYSVGCGRGLPWVRDSGVRSVTSRAAVRVSSLRHDVDSHAITIADLSVQPLPSVIREICAPVGCDLLSSFLQECSHVRRWFYGRVFIRTLNRNCIVSVRVNVRGPERRWYILLVRLKFDRLEVVANVLEYSTRINKILLSESVSTTNSRVSPKILVKYG